jgi:pimeloyl-ACP methyl ester carboxylesterase
MFVPIGGIEQWITITGDDLNNPLVLNLHGGPGAVASPFSDAMFGDWYPDFVVVQWDQRGAGRTYTRTGPRIQSTMTIDRIVQDGIEVAEFVRQHLGKDKVILTGGSWGSVVGIRMAKARPDLFYAYVGVAQIVSGKDLFRGYARTLALARQAQNTTAITDLEVIGPPPWDHLRKLGVFSRWTRFFETQLGGPALDLKPSGEYASEEGLREEAANFSQMHFFGLDMRGPLTALDLPGLVSDPR